MSENGQAEITREYLRLIHEHRLRSEGAVEHALNKMDSDSGWHEDAMPIMFMRADIGAYRRMADQMERCLERLTKQEAA